MTEPTNKELTGGKSHTNGRAARIQLALSAKFQPTQLVVEDQSAAHAGHAGAQPGGETHFRVMMRAPALAGLSRIARARAVNDALKAEFDTGLHALSLDLG